MEISRALTKVLPQQCRGNEKIVRGVGGGGGGGTAVVLRTSSPRRVGLFRDFLDQKG